VALWLVTVAAAITQVILVTFHGLSLAAHVVLILFYAYALIVAREFLKQEQANSLKVKERGVIYQRLRNGLKVAFVEIGGILV